MHDDKNVKYITSLKEIRVINDPYRREIITAMSLMEKPSTAKEIADFMGEPPSKVNYHVGILHKHSFIDLDHTENINGIIAKFYTRSKNEFKIKMEGKGSKTKEISAIRDIVASTFDMSRDKHIALLAKSFDKENDGSDKEIEEFMFSKTMYLNQDEVKEFNSFMERVAKNNAKGERKLYDFFAAYVELDDHYKK